MAIVYFKMGGFEKLRRVVRTVYFMTAMVLSLVVLSAPVAMAVFDVLAPYLLVSNFTCVSCYGFKEHLHRYSFRGSLIDVPVVSFVRSLVIIYRHLHRYTFRGSLIDVPLVSLVRSLVVIRDILRTVCVMAAMVLALVVLSEPLALTVFDVLAPFLLVTNFTCVSCYGVEEHLHRYSLRGSLIDVPVASLIGSLVIICVYLMCDGPALSHGPYFGTVMVCSISSTILLSVKSCLFSVHSQIESEAYSSTGRKLHLKKSWGMPVLFLSSVVFALGHIVVAYRASCKARRKLLFHRADSEAALSCKIVFSGFQKVPRSPTPSATKTPKTDSEMRHKHGKLARDEGEFPVKLLADVDSLFVSCQGLTVHYKLSRPGSPPHSLSSPTFFDRPKMSVEPKNQYIKRCYSNQFYTSSLHDPLIDRSATSLALSEEMPVLSLDDFGEPSPLSSPREEHDLEENMQIGIVLVHGFGGGVFSWRHVMGALSRQVNCTVAAFDRPGWGLTSRLRRQDWEDFQLSNPYSLESQVDLILSFCTEMGFSSVILVGHDDGGLLALKTAQKVLAMDSANIKIKGVVLLGTSLSREVVTGFARILLRTSLGKKHLVRPLLRTEITQVVNRRAWYDANKLSTEVLSIYKAPFCVEGWDEALREIGKLSFETVHTPENATLLLQAIEDLPVLVIAGAEDALVPLKSAQVMASNFVNSKLVAISGCGHLPHEECPKALLAAISPFISRILQRSDRQQHY